MIKGPCEYVPPVEVQRVQYHRAIPLDRNEGSVHSTLVNE